MSAWETLARLQHAASGRKILELFDDGDRLAQFSARLGLMVFDFSKTNIDGKTLATLIELARQADVAGHREAMFSGAKINETEGRAVLHTALRILSGGVQVDGVDVMPEVRKTHARMSSFAQDVRSGVFAGQGGRITDVVNIGIGGSDLGPAMA